MKKLIFANWKSHKLSNQVAPWFAEIGVPPAGTKVVVIPPAHLLSTVEIQLPNEVALGAQNVSPFPLGAYTGEIAAAQLADLSVSFCLVGHSERRRFFGETDASVVTKCQLLLESAITPVVCVDEPYLKSQLGALQAAGVSTFICAYEPVAAIGSGHNVSLDEVQKAKDAVSSFGVQQFIYGGSVSGENVAEYLLICDGALVATASLDGQEFAKLLAVAAGEQPSFSQA